MFSWFLKDLMLYSIEKNYDKSFLIRFFSQRTHDKQSAWIIMDLGWPYKKDLAFFMCFLVFEILYNNSLLVRRGIKKFFNNSLNIKDNLFLENRKTNGIKKRIFHFCIASSTSWHIQSRTLDIETVRKSTIH